MYVYATCGGSVFVYTVTVKQLQHVSYFAHSRQVDREIPIIYPTPLYVGKRWGYFYIQRREIRKNLFPFMYKWILQEMRDIEDDKRYAQPIPLLI